MSLPPGFLDELRNRVSLSQVVGRKVMWDMRKSNQAKGDWWSPCPFHQEKTASFHVDDRKGFYYCFGCHAKGDAISFLKDADNMGFMEAVEALAQEAGMTMPARDPRAQEKADKRTELAEVMEAAVRHYRLQLTTQVAQPARDYLERRGLDAATLERFEIGFAPDARQGIFQHLTGRGISADKIVEAGLCARPDDGGAPYDRFRGRIMFPIRDARGRCIAFGGRAMDPNARAKYLNSPETILFDKGRSLYNHGPARTAVGKGQRLIVAEGYMDVIALCSAGFEGAVAPLGTAITENQLAMLWAINPEPVIGLDGDKAGLRAAYRLMDLALPLMEAGKSLRFALMPEGQDPDDLIRAKGPAAMEDLLSKALPMVDLLWRRETEGQVYDSPERRAALDRSLRSKIKSIPDASLRHHYGEAIKELRYQLFRPQRGPGNNARSNWAGGNRQGGSWGRGQPVKPMPTTRNSMLVASGEEGEEYLREAVILATLIVAPQMLTQFEAQVERMECLDPDHALLRDLILTHAHSGADPLTQAISDAMGGDALDQLLSRPHVALSPTVRNRDADEVDEEKARMTLGEELAKLQARRGLRAEIREAEEEITGQADEAVTWRLTQAANAMNRAAQSQQKDRAEYDMGENGARINREERGRLDALMETIRFQKPGK
jgi:DNA primase